MASTFSFKDVSANLIGPTGSINLGYGAGVGDEGISIDMGGDKNTMMIGADGHGMHSLHADKSGTISVRLLKVSATNQLLMQAYDAQQLSAALWGQNVIVVRQTQSGDTTTANNCAFKKKPTIKYAKDGDVMDWIFDSIHIETALGVY